MTDKKNDAKDVKDDVEYGVSLTAPILGGLFGVESKQTASDDKHTGHGSTKEEAKADLNRQKK